MFFRNSNFHDFPTRFLTALNLKTKVWYHFEEISSLSKRRRDNDFTCAMRYNRCKWTWCHDRYV